MATKRETGQITGSINSQLPNIATHPRAFGGCEVGGGGLEMEEGKAVIFKPMLLLDNPDNDIPIRLGLGIPAWENSGCD